MANTKSIKQKEKMKNTEKSQMVLVNPSHRILSGLGLSALGMVLIQFWRERNLNLSGPDFILFLVICFFFITAAYCMFSWSKTTFIKGHKNFHQETFHFGFYKKVREGICSSVFFQQTPQLRPSYTLFLTVKGSDDLIIREGLKRSDARKIGNNVASICGLPSLPDDPVEEVQKTIHNFDDDIEEDELDEDKLDN
ncbi:hypothetical protein PQO03_06810 [Lentisphaera profundi]|uniref:DUF304 domain-containing protein n=1 Tax=Lentisphaera profundi TaxID=1658616 RepID=A0ABY7VRD7_9BACT|nr:hypothetical protein [Lentisphaera profundi]WDE95426.1 hypothetical protein PQO03_06810 [Lentisphaera profundi]